MDIHCFFKVGVLALALLVAGASCRSGDPPNLEMVLVTSPAPQSGTCPSSGALDLDKEGPGGVRVIRMTFFDAEAGPPSAASFLCDRLVTAADRRSPFYLRANQRSRVHVRVEAFGGVEEPEDATRLVASGYIEDVPVSAGAPSQVFVPVAGQMGCTLGSMSLARAFHSATALPGGRVLIVGGLLAVRGESPTVDPGKGFFLSDSVEIYHGGRGSFVQPVVTGEPGVRRAFHDAFLLPGATPEMSQVLLLGGVGQGSVPDASGVVQIRQGPQHPFRLTPEVGAEPASAEILTVNLTVDPPTVHRSSVDLEGWPGRYFQGADYYGPSKGACIAGGATGVEAFGTFYGSSGVDLGYPDNGTHYPLSGNMTLLRVGMSLTTLDATTAVAWGGNLGQVDPLSTLAERLTLSPAPPTSSMLVYDELGSGRASPAATVFHTATLLDGGDLLVVGGFEVTGGVALDPVDATAIHRVNLTDGSFTMHGQSSAGFVQVGYHATVRLADGKVLIAGGSPRNQPGMSHCETGQLWTCSLPQAFLYTQGLHSAGVGSLVALPGDGLVVPRFGHRMVVLPGGVVLVTGGIRQDGSSLLTEASAEVYNHATGVASEDAPLFREPGALFSADSECPVFK